MATKIGHEFICKICDSECKFLHKESKKGQIFKIFKCMSCGTVQVGSIYADISPNYISLNYSDIGKAHIWMNREHKFKAYEAFLKLIKKLYPEQYLSYKIIDVGCGTGGFLEYLKKHNFICYGFDASQAQVKYANNSNLPVDAAVSADEYIYKNPKYINNFNITTLWDVLEHIRDPESFLKTLHILLVKNGLLYISVPSSGGHVWKKPLYLLFKKKYSFDPWEHVFFYNRKSLTMLLKKCGFTVIWAGETPCYERPKNIKEILRRIFFLFFRLIPSLHPQISILAKSEI